MVGVWMTDGADFYGSYKLTLKTMLLFEVESEYLYREDKVIFNRVQLHPQSPSPNVAFKYRFLISVLDQCSR